VNEDFRPYVTWLCLGAIVAVFLRFGLDAQSDMTRYVRAGCVVPAYVATGEWWRLLTANFVHFGFFHLFMNGYALFLLGPRLEWELGHLRYLLLVLLTGTGGTALATLLGTPYFHLAGFSAALFGFLGAHMAIGIRVGRGLTNFVHSPGGRWLLTLLAINFLIGLMPQWNISNEAHFGGLVLGFLVTMHLFRIVRYEPKPVNTAWTLLLWGALVVYCLHPVQAPWFLARAYWTAPEGERGERYEALVSRAPDDRDMWEQLRWIREGRGMDRPTGSGGLNWDGLRLGLRIRFGMSTRGAAAVVARLSAMFEGASDPPPVPEDPWQH